MVLDLAGSSGDELVLGIIMDSCLHSLGGRIRAVEAWELRKKGRLQLL